MVKGRTYRERSPSLSDDEMIELEEAEDLQLSRKRNEALSDEEVFGFDDSDDLEDDAEDDKNEDLFDMGSDIEEDEKLPDDRAWGKSNRRFYNTDYVDQDYEGFYQGKEAEEAELEEQEARQIQKRLTEQLNEADFVIADTIDTQQPLEDEAFESITTDASSLSTRQKLDLLKKESPEFFLLIDDLKSKLKEVQLKLMPIVDFYEKRPAKPTPLVKFVQKKFLLFMNYCTNISFYLLLKAKRIPVRNHPVLKSLYKYRKLLEQISEIDSLVKPQVEELLENLKNGNMLVQEKPKVKRRQRKKNILKMVTKTKKAEEKLDSIEMDEKMNNEDVNKSEHTEAKRAITYEMAKNKGLMPKRNKDQRNPRVKHRKKYRKALIKRRGQVRTARKEIPVYGGEPTGIKVHVTKSIKLK